MGNRRGGGRTQKRRSRRRGNTSLQDSPARHGRQRGAPRQSFGTRRFMCSAPVANLRSLSGRRGVLGWCRRTGRLDLGIWAKTRSAATAPSSAVRNNPTPRTPRTQLQLMTRRCGVTSAPSTRSGNRFRGYARNALAISGYHLASPVTLAPRANITPDTHPLRKSDARHSQQQSRQHGGGKTGATHQGGSRGEHVGGLPMNTSACRNTWDLQGDPHLLEPHLLGITGRRRCPILM